MEIEDNEVIGLHVDSISLVDLLYCPSPGLAILDIDFYQSHFLMNSCSTCMWRFLGSVCEGVGNCLALFCELKTHKPSFFQLWLL